MCAGAGSEIKGQYCRRDREGSIIAWFHSHSEVTIQAR